MSRELGSSAIGREQVAPVYACIERDSQVLASPNLDLTGFRQLDEEIDRAKSESKGPDRECVIEHPDPFP